MTNLQNTYGLLPEKRLDDSDCTKEWLIDDNETYINGFQQAGEQVVIVDDDYENTVGNLL